jgi:hypothetical protein
MSVGTKLLQAAAGNAGEVVYVDDVFSTFLWTGDSSGSRSINNGIDLDGEGGLVWIKGRTAAYDHAWYDTARGATKEMYSNKTDAQQTNSNALTSFNSNGFTIGAGPIVNNNNDDYVAWSFRKAEKFFDIVTWTGSGAANHTINHNLGSVPGMIIWKKYSNTDSWGVYHRSFTGYILLEGTAGNSTVVIDNVTDTSFRLKYDYGFLNASSETYVAYIFGHNEAEYGQNSDEAIIHCGTYTGSGSTGKFVDLGFEPQWVLVKNTDTSAPWVLIDTMRGMPVDGDGVRLLADQNVAEVSSASYFAPRPTGMEVTQQNTYVNTSGQNYVYMAIRRPNKPASEFAATGLFDTNLTTSDSLVQTSLTRTDLNIQKDRGSAYFLAQSRLTGNVKYLQTNSNNAESNYSTSDPVGVFDTQGKVRTYAGSESNVIWSFMRAKGFFDVVTYTSNTTYPNTFNHNLGVVPELILIKRRDSSSAWAVYSATTGNTKHLVLSSNAGESASSYWNNTTPTSTVVTVGGQDETWGYGGYTYIAYLFATVTGISKVGSYTGTGSDLNVDCGFSAGVRFVFIKRTDSTGDWYLYDSERGIVAGNDPYVRLNKTNAEVTNTDYIDPLSSGFTVTSSAPADLNASSGTYIFLAIA